MLRFPLRWYSFVHGNTNLGWLSVFCALSAVTSSIASGKIPHNDIYNADTFQLATLLADLWQQGTLAGWDLPVNPPLFPDGLLFGPLWLLIPNLYVLYVAYGIVQVLLFLVGSLYLLRYVYGRAPGSEAWLLLATALFLLWVATGRHSSLAFIFVPGHHFGILLVLPTILGLTLSLLWGANPLGLDPKPGYVSSAHPAQFFPSGGLKLGVWLGLCILLTAFSDALFLVQVTIPLSITLGLFALRQPAWRSLSLQVSGLLLITSASGHVVRLLVVGSEKLNRYYAPVTLEQARQFFYDWVARTVQQEPLFSGYWLSALAALLWVGVLALQDLRRYPLPAQPPPLSATTQQRLPPIRLLFVVTYLLLTIILSGIAPLVAGNFFSSEHTRYLLPTLYLPLLLGWPLLLAYLASCHLPAIPIRSRAGFITAGRFLTTGGVALLFVACIGYALLSLDVRALAQLPNHTDITARCLDEHAQQIPLYNGMTHFWQASYLRLLSRANLNIVQVNQDLSIYLYNNNLHWYDNAFDFILVDRNAPIGYQFDQKVIINQFGPPAQTFHCGYNEVLVYNRPADLPFQRHLQTQPVRARFDQPGDSFTFYGSSLPSPIGGRGIGLSKAASESWGNLSGELGAVPLVQLPADTYHFAIHAYTDSANTGRWVISSQRVEQTSVLAQGDLAATGRQIAQGTFTLTTSSDVRLAILYEGHGALYVDKVWLQRAGADEPAKSTPSGNGQLTLLYPRPNSFLVQPQVDFVWQWTGAPLAAQQAFEVRIWHKDDPCHYGAHDAAASRPDLRQIDDTYTLHLDLGGAYSMQQRLRGTYSWSVAIVTVEPTYQDLQIEAPVSRFYWEPQSPKVRQ